MSLQITVLPLKGDVNLLAICQATFQSVEHHPRNDKNPYDFCLLTTEAGTEIEGLLHSNTLSLDVHSSDLNDASFADALFKIAKDGPCAISSEDADVFAVTDPRFVSMTASAVEYAEDAVEPVTSGSDLLDLLFGIEPPRIESPDLASSLKALGFQIDRANHHRATLRLKGGIFLEIDPDEHFGWDKTGGVSLGLANSRFATVMDGWSTNISGPLARLDPRKARQDRAGFILWSGHLPFQTLPATVETPVLGIYDRAMPFDDVVTRLSQTGSPKELAKEVFGGDLAPFVIPTEGEWVFLFLLAEAKCDRDEILDIYSDLKAADAAFGTIKGLESDVIDAYLDLHKNRLAARD